VVSDSSGTQLLVFSNDSDSVTVLFPGLAVPPVDTSCLTNPPNAVCVVIPGFSRPVYAVINGSTAYILNCGTQCGGSAFNGSSLLQCGPSGSPVAQACVTVLDLSTLTITNTIPVDAATWGLLSGSALYVAGTPPPPTPGTNTCTGGTTTAASTCGRLDVIDLNSMTVTNSAVITDGYHDRMDMGLNGQLFIGSHDCTNIGNSNNPSGEVRGCLTIFNTISGNVVIPPENGDVVGLQGFTSRYVEYVAQGGALYVYDTLYDSLLFTDFIPLGTIDVIGKVGDVKAIDFF